MKNFTISPIKTLIVICSFVGIIICLITARYDGYSHWTKRLLYFTNQSNIWVFIVTILSLLPFANSGKTNQKSLFIARYIFTISILLTGIVFCCFLGPFADKSYHAWSVSGYLLHLATPILVLTDFFVQRTRFFINKKVILLTLIPPLIYLTLTSILFFFNIDFGRGDNFPYFFLNYLSPAGLMGFSSFSPYFLGSLYWVIVLLFLILFFAVLLMKINNKMCLKNNKTA